jgi:hypothetical protein
MPAQRGCRWDDREDEDYAPEPGERDQLQQREEIGLRVAETPEGAVGRD